MDKDSRFRQVTYGKVIVHSEKNVMIKRKKRVIKSVIILFVLVVLVFSLVYQLFYSMDHLPKGDIMGSFESPDQSYAVNMYLYNGGATSSYAVRGELIITQTGKRKNIYWKYKEEKSVVIWINDSMVSINGIILDVTRDRWDWKNQ